jgi:hypothetical protein
MLKIRITRQLLLKIFLVELKERRYKYVHCIHFFMYAWHLPNLPLRLGFSGYKILFASNAAMHDWKLIRISQVILEKIDILSLVRRNAYRYFPDGTTRGVLFGAMVSVIYLIVIKIVKTIFEKIVILCLRPFWRAPIFLELECSYSLDIDLT